MGTNSTVTIDTARAVDLAYEVSVRRPSLDDGSGALRTIAENCLRDDPEASWKDVAAEAEKAAAEVDPDAQCPEHGCARWRCDDSHAAEAKQ